MALFTLLLLAPAAALAPPRARRSRAAALHMGWGDPPVWSDAVIKSNDEACAGHRAITLEVPEATKEAFATPGQYVQLTLGEEKPGFYAIASAPGAEFEFLIKENEGNAYLTSLKPGATLQCSEVSGGGYKYEANFGGDTASAEYDGFACMNVLFAAGGSGIAPIRSCIEGGVAAELPKPATLYFGARDAAVTAYADKFASWEADHNVRVRLCHSKEAAPGAFRGYVQEAMAADTIAVPRNTGACVCGPKDMFVAVKELLMGAGVYEVRILSNF